MRLIVVLLTCLLVPSVAVGKPTRHGVDEFKGDRLTMLAWGGMTPDVIKAVRQKRKGKKARPHHERSEKAQRPVTVIVPLPRVRPEPPMDADQEAAYRVIAALLANGKVYVKPLPAKPKNIFAGFRDELLKAARPPKGRSLAGIVKPLAVKVMAIASACPGTVVISTVRPGAVVRGSGRPSLHRYGKAVDIAGPYRCIYAALKGFPGGYSTDAHRVRHVHMSWDPKGREWGSRFAHYRGGVKRTRYARHHRRHYASAR